MGKNFWKITTIGLVGYIVGRERNNPYKKEGYSGRPPMRYGDYVPGWGYRPNKSKVEKFVDRVFEVTRAKREEYQRNNLVKSITFNTKDDAYSVLDKLCEEVNNFGKTSLTRFLELCGCYAICAEKGEYKDYGWTDLSSAVPFLQSDGRWILDMPKLEYIPQGRWSYFASHKLGYDQDDDNEEGEDSDE